MITRKTTERPEGVAAGNARLAGTSRTCLVAEATGSWRARSTAPPWPTPRGYVRGHGHSENLGRQRQPGESAKRLR